MTNINWSEVYKQCYTTFNIARTKWKVIALQTNNLIQRKSKVSIKMGNLMKWYDEFTGMDEVRLAQNRVLEAEKKFVIAQETRRDATNELTKIQPLLEDLRTKFDKTSRGDDMYVQLIQEEAKIIKEEKRLMRKLQLHEREEREYFSLLSSSVKESHEKERIQAERTKYWSIIGSIIGTIIGIVGTSINNEVKMNKFKKLILEVVDNNKEIKNNYNSNSNNNLNAIVDLVNSKEELFNRKLEEVTLVLEKITQNQITSVETSTMSNENIDSKKYQHYVIIGSIITAYALYFGSVFLE